VATIDGSSKKSGWKLYQSKNEDTGIAVSSLLIDIDDQLRGAICGTGLLRLVSREFLFLRALVLLLGTVGWSRFFWAGRLGLRASWGWGLSWLEWWEWVRVVMHVVSRGTTSYVSY
jgi:hypothetical protein